MSGNRATWTRCAGVLAVLAAVGVTVVTPTAATAATVTLSVEPYGATPYANPDTSVSVQVHLKGVEDPLTLRATFHFGALTDRLEVKPGSGCGAASGGRYVCEESAGSDETVVLGIPVTARPDRSPSQGSVPVDVRALDSAGNEVAGDSTQVRIDIVSNRVDLSVSVNSEFSYLMVGPDSWPIAAYVPYPTPTWPLPVRVTYDFGPGNNSYLLTLDLATGSVRTRLDMGEATGDIGDTVKLPVTMRNLGPDTMPWMSVVAHEFSDSGLELVGWEGCASSGINPSSECHAPDWMRGGTSHTVYMLIKIRGCLDNHGVTAGMSAAIGIHEVGSTGVVHVNGCGGRSGVTGTDGGWGGVPGRGGQVSLDLGDAVLAGGAGEPSGPAPTPTAPGAGGSSSPGASGTDGYPVAVGEVQGTDTGLGGTGLLLMLALLAVARAARWALPTSGGA